MRYSTISFFFLSLLPLFFTSTGYTNPPWKQWVKSLRIDAIEQGIQPKLFDKIFNKIKRPNPRVIRYDKNQPEKRITYLKYQRSRVDAYRIKIGKKREKQYSQLLTPIAKEYGVNQCYILSFWGLETAYGNFMGSFPVIQSLATLAYDSRRSTFFRKQLMYALKIVNEGHVPLDKLKGEWAGASGHPQFLPSSWYHYAIDHNKDGRKDIWDTKVDVFASIANYLVQHGWKSNQPVLAEVKMTQHAINLAQGLKVIKPLRVWIKEGVRVKNPSELPSGDTPTALVMPEGGPPILAFPNFNVIMKWNRSIYYVGAVDYLARNICK